MLSLLFCYVAIIQRDRHPSITRRFHFSKAPELILLPLCKAGLYNVKNCHVDTVLLHETKKDEQDSSVI